MTPFKFGPVKKDARQGTDRLADQSSNIKTENESFRRPT